MYSIKYLIFSFGIRFSYRLIKGFLNLRNFIKKKVKSLINSVKDLINLIKNSEILIENLEIRSKNSSFPINRLRISDFNLRNIIISFFLFFLNKRRIKILLFELNFVIFSIIIIIIIRVSLRSLRKIRIVIRSFMILYFY